MAGIIEKTTDLSPSLWEECIRT